MVRNGYRSIRRAREKEQRAEHLNRGVNDRQVRVKQVAGGVSSRSVPGPMLTLESSVAPLAMVAAPSEPDRFERKPEAGVLAKRIAKTGVQASRVGKGGPAAVGPTCGWFRRCTDPRFLPFCAME